MPAACGTALACRGPITSVSLTVRRLQPIHEWVFRLAALAAIWIAAHAHAAAAVPPTLEFSAAEREWLARHPVIRVGFDPAWPPFSVVTADGKCSGIDGDLLARISQQLGVRFEFVTRSNWTETYEAAQRGEIDVLTGTSITIERAREFEFTEPYLSFPIIIVTRNDEPILWSVLDLVGRRLAGVRDYVATLEMARKYPEIEVVPTDSVAQAMEFVSRGKADAFITNLPNASFIAKTRGFTNLKIAGVMPERFDLRYAVRSDWPEFAGILDRAIASLTEADRQALVHPWIRVDYEKVIRWDIVWRTALVAFCVVGLVLGAVLYHNRRLARELVERIRLQREIKEAHDESVRLHEEKTELLQMAAHDLRGPLTGMQLVVDSSLRLNAVPHPEALNLIEKQIRQMTALLNDLLDVEALESGRRELRLEILDARQVVRSAVNGLVAVAENKEIRLDASAVALTVPPVRADATAFRQIADNLISNAIKFSPRNSVIEITLEQRGDFVRLEVGDQGPGVPPAETERIFAKYARGSARPTAGEKSTGLGLSIVRQLASGLNGRVWCENRPKGGAVFIFLIPAAPGASAAEPTPTSGDT